jgi:hypothetical protein
MQCRREEKEDRKAPAYSASSGKRTLGTNVTNKETADL